MTPITNLHFTTTSTFKQWYIENPHSSSESSDLSLPPKVHSVLKQRKTQPPSTALLLILNCHLPSQEFVLHLFEHQDPETGAMRFLLLYLTTFGSSAINLSAKGSKSNPTTGHKTRTCIKSWFPYTDNDGNMVTSPKWCKAFFIFLHRTFPALNSHLKVKLLISLIIFSIHGPKIATTLSVSKIHAQV